MAEVSVDAILVATTEVKFCIVCVLAYGANNFVVSVIFNLVSNPATDPAYNA